MAQLNTSHDQDIIRLHAEGKGRNAIARELGIPWGSVTNYARRLGLSFDNGAALMAVEIRRREAAERRAILALTLLDDVERIRERMFSPIKMIQYGGKEFERREDELDEPIPQDQASLARAATMLLDRAVKLDEYDRGGAGLDDALNFLQGVQITIRGQVIPQAELEAGDGGNDRVEPETG